MLVESSSALGNVVIRLEGTGLVKENRRNWRIFVVPGSHFDLGWCATPAECLAYSDEIIRSALEAILGPYPGFRFTVEYAYFFKHFLESYPEYKEAAGRLLEEGKIEVCGAWTGMMDQILDGEAMIRNVVWAKMWIRNEFERDAATVQLSDCPGRTIQLPQVLRKSGVEYFVCSRFSPPIPVYLWRALDGSEVLAVNHHAGLYRSNKDHGFAGYGWGIMLRRGYEEVRRNLPSQLERLSEVWPTDEVLMADQSDILMPAPEVCDAIERWSRKDNGAKMQTGVISDFFKAVDQSGKRKELPTYLGEAPYEFYSIPAFEVETYLEARRAENSLLSAEKFSSWEEILGLGRYESKRIDSAWEALFYPHDHNVGGRHGEINDEVRTHKARYARIVAEEALQESTMSITTHINYTRDAIPLVVFNPSSWRRTDVAETFVEFTGPGEDSVVVTDVNGDEVPSQIVSRERSAEIPGFVGTRFYIVFTARDVPPQGYSTYYIERRKPGVKWDGMTATEERLENKFYSIRLEDGWMDKLIWRGRNLVSEGFNEVFVLEDVATDIEEQLTGRRWLASENSVRAEVLENGPVRVRLLLEGKVLSSPISQEIILYAEIPRVDFRTTVNWEGRRNSQVRLSYPFVLSRGQITYETPYGSVRFPQDEMEGTYRGTGGRFTGKWIDISNMDYGVTLASRSGCTSLEEGAISPVLIRTAYSCGTRFYWYDNVGSHTFGHSLLAHEGTWRDAHSFRHGWEYNSPLIVTRMSTARPIAPVKGRTFLPESGSLCSLDQPNVVMTTMKRAYSGDGWIVRLVEVEGRETEVRLKFPFELSDAHEVDLMEGDARPVHHRNGGVRLLVSAYGIHTLLVIGDW